MGVTVLRLYVESNRALGTGKLDEARPVAVVVVLSDDRVVPTEVCRSEQRTPDASGLIVSRPDPIRSPRGRHAPFLHGCDPLVSPDEERPWGGETARSGGMKALAGP